MTSPQPAPDPLGRRLQLLNTHGHGWMDPNTQVTLAQAAQPDNALLTIADAMKSRISSTWDGVAHFFDDPVLQKTPTTSLALHRYLTSAIGPLPVQDTDIAHMQQQLRAEGYDVRTDGQWDQGSQSALNQHSQKLVHDQLAGNKPGSITVGKALHGLLSALTPVGAAEHIVGFVKSIPGDVRQITADTVGLGAMATDFLQQEVAHPTQVTSNIEKSRQQGRALDLWTQQHLWNHTITADDIQSQTTGINILGKALSDIGTVFMFTGVGGAAKGLGEAAGKAALGGFTRDLTAKEAMRGPGVIAKTLGAGRLTSRAATGAALGGTAGGVQAAARGQNVPLGIAEGAAVGGVGGALIPGRVWNNLPVLKHTGPVIGKLADADGLYYKTRTRLAMPYQYKAVQGAGELMGRVQMQGLKIGALNTVGNVLGQNNTDLGNNIDQTTFLDTINDSIANHTRVPGFGGKLHADLNDLMFFLHAPVSGAGRLSQQADDHADALATGFVSAAGGHTDAIAQFERGLGRSYPQLLADAGGNSHALNAWMSHKIRSFAAYRYADQTVNQMGFDATLPDSAGEILTLKKALASKVWNDPELMDRYTAEMLSDRQNYIETGLKNELTLEKSNPKQKMRQELGEFLDGGEILNRQILPHQQALLHPGTFEALSGARADTEFSAATALPPVRRGDFVKQFHTLRKAVQAGIVDTTGHVDAAEKDVQSAKAAFEEAKKAGGDVAGARKAYRAAVNARTQTANRVQRMQSALDNGSGDLISYANAADKAASRSTSSYLKTDYTRWQDAAHKLRNLVQPGVEGDYNLRDMLAGRYDPNAVYDSLYGARKAEHAAVGPKMNWLSDNNPEVAQGAIGLARTDTLTAQDARRAYDAFDARINDPKADQGHLDHDLRMFLHTEFGLDYRKLSVFGTPKRLMEVLDQRSQELASEVFHAEDAPQEVIDGFARLKAKGYKVVHGTDIGHLYAGTYGDVADLGTGLNRRQKLAGALMTSPLRYSHVDHAADLRMRVATEIRKAVDDGKVALPAFYTPQTVLSDLRDDKILARQMPWLENTIFSITRRLHQRDIDLALEHGDTPVGKPSEAVALAENRVKDNIVQSLGLRDISRKQVLNTLTRPDDVTGIPMMSTEHANEVYKAILRAYTNRPTYMTGLSHLEDTFRDAFWKYGDKIGIKGNSDASAMLLNLPNNLIRLRDRYRFTLSPYFSFRRIAKTNVKMALEGVVPALDPTKRLIETNEFDKANRVLDRVLGHEDARNRWLDESDRYLHSQDIFGLYNARRFEAYFANELAKAGKTDDEIRTAITKTFSYGGRYGEGRSALERTTNMIFFPFSFEKTLYRNVGHYLLDHPAQAMVLAGGLRAYKDFNDHHLDGNNPLAASWYEQHAPLLNEALRLNAFAHGISAGELGGINAPLLNAFMPQSWDSSQASHKTLKRFIPAVADLQRIMREAPDQAHVVSQSAINGFSIVRDTATRTQHGPLYARPSNKTHDAQMTEAIDLRNKMIEQIKPVLDFNSKHSGDKTKQYLWPTTPDIPTTLHGQPVTKTSLGELIHQFYPAFDPAGGQLYAIQKQNEAKAWLAKRAGTPQYDAYSDFADKADTAARHLSTDDYDTKQAIAVQQAFRDRAAELARQDGAFLDFYTRHYARAFGPIVRIK